MVRKFQYRYAHLKNIYCNIIYKNFKLLGELFDDLLKFKYQFCNRT